MQNADTIPEGSLSPYRLLDLTDENGLLASRILAASIPPLHGWDNTGTVNKFGAAAIAYLALYLAHGFTRMTTVVRKNATRPSRWRDSRTRPCWTGKKMMARIAAQLRGPAKNERIVRNW